MQRFGRDVCEVPDEKRTLQGEILSKSAVETYGY